LSSNVDKEGYEDPKSEEGIIAEAKAFYTEDRDYELDVRKEQRDDHSFGLGKNHWRGQAYTSRNKSNRPMLVVPRMDEFLNQVKNEERQNKPQIKVSPRGAQSQDIQEKRVRAAKNRQGLMRFIQSTSKANQAYQTAFGFSVDIGRGFFRIITDYVSHDTFDQEIIIERIKDPFTVTCDRNRQEIDYSDMKRAFIEDKMPRERFKAAYPDAKPSHWINRSVKDMWMTQDDITVVEYYAIRYRKRVLYMLDDGELGFEDELSELEEETAADIKANIVERRKVKVPYIKWYKITSLQVLEEKDILGEYIPIIPTIGIETTDDGQLVIMGMIRKLKDSARLYDFWSSTEAELLTLAPKAPYIAEKSQIKGFEKYWENLNTQSNSILPYNATDLKGKPIPPPQRVTPVPVPIGIVNAKAGTVDDMRAITGMYGPSLGQTGQEKSGRAIIAQQRKGDTATYHYIDNLGIALTHAGRIINDWMPIVYSGDRIEKILGEDGEESTIELGGKDENGDLVELGSGKFDVVVTMGPSHMTKRQEAAESMMAFMQAVPNVVPLIYDLLVRNMDWPGAQEIADRLRKTIPPQLLEEQGGEKQMAQQLQELIGKVQQYEELIPMLSQQLERAMKELDDEGAEIAKDLELQRMKSATDITVANIRSDTERNKTFANVLQNVRTTTPNSAP